MINVGTIITVCLLLFFPSVTAPQLARIETGVEVSPAGLTLYCDPVFLLYGKTEDMRGRGQTTFSVIVLQDELRRDPQSHKHDYILHEELLHTQQFRALGFAAYLLAPWMEPPVQMEKHYDTPSELDAVMWQPPEWMPCVYHFLSLRIPLPIPCTRWGWSS